MVRILRWLQLACFAWVAWLPVSQPLILYPALAALAGSSALLWLADRRPVPRDLKLAAAIYVVFVAAVAAQSFAKDNPGVVHQTALWAGIPLIWVPWAMTLRGEHLRRTFLVLVVVGGLSATAVVLLAIEALGGPSLPAALKDIQQMWFTVSADGQIELAYLGLSSMVGLAAFVLAAAFVPGGDPWLPRRRVLVVVAGLAFVAAIVSGRRGLAVVVLLAPMLAIAYVTLLVATRRPVPVRVSAYLVGLVTAAVAVGVLMASPLGANLKSFLGLPPGLGVGAASETTGGPAPGSGSGPGEDVNTINDAARADQLPELVDGWRSEPILGQGFGAVLDSGYQRSDERPWMFETQPLQILMNVGIVGYLVLLLITGLVARVVIRAFRTGHHRPTLVASVVTCLAMLVADVTNPYLQAPGHGWAVFLVIGVCVTLLGAQDDSAGTDVLDRNADMS